MNTLRVFTAAVVGWLVFSAWARSDEAAPAQRSADFRVAAVLRHPTALAGAHDVAISEDLAFVAGKSGSLSIVDIAAPRKPELVWHRHDPEKLFEAETVLISGSRLFLGTRDLFSIDFSDPRQPRFDDHLELSPRSSRINGMVRRDSYVFTANKGGWIGAFDVSRPDTPREIGSCQTRQRWELDSPHDLDLLGPYLVVAEPQGFGRFGKDGKVGVFRAFDAAGQLLPPEQWVLEGVVSSPELMGANRVQVAGDKAYVAGSWAGKPAHFVVIDLAVPERPRQLAALPFSDLHGPNGLTVAGNVVFLAGGQTLEGIDIREPGKPRRMVAQRIAEALPTGEDNAHDLVYRDGWLYVTGQNDDCLVVVRVENQAIWSLACERPEAAPWKSSENRGSPACTTSAPRRGDQDVVHRYRSESSASRGGPASSLAGVARQRPAMVRVNAHDR